MSKKKQGTRSGRPPEIWVGVVDPMADGERVAVAWVRRRDEWLAELTVALRGEEIDALARIYREAVDRRGSAPDRLNLRDAGHADALRAVIGSSPPIRAGFDTRARALSDAAASAVEIAFDAEGLLADPDSRYDPELAPDPQAWLATPPVERRRRVRLAHMHLDEEPSDERAQMHAAMHEAVETQLAHRDPPEASEAVARLVAGGLSRHQAIHAVAGAFMRRMHQVATGEGPFDSDGYAADLRALPCE